MPPDQITQYVDPRQYLEHKSSSKKWLFAVLGFTGLILIGFALWYFQIFSFNFKPQTHSILSFNKDQPKEVAKGDYLSGKGLKDSTVELIFSPKTEKYEVKTDKEGIWKFQLPTSLIGTYSLSVLTLNKDNDLVLLKIYQLKIIDNSFLPKIKLPKFSNISTVYAQGTDYDWEKLQGPDWASWLALQHKLDVYPAIEGKEIINYTSRSEYEKRYCQSQTCSFQARSLNEWQVEFDSNLQFFYHLFTRMVQDGYRIEALQPYFPDLQNYVNISRVGYPLSQEAKYTVDEETLTRYINEVAISRGFAEKDLFKNIMTASDPATGARSIYNLLSGYELNTTEDRVMGVWAMVSILPQIRAMGQTAAKVTMKGINYSRMAADAAVIRHAIQTEGSVTYLTVAGRAREWHGTEILPPARFPVGAPLTVEGGIARTPRLPRATYIYNNNIKRLIDSGAAQMISRSDVLAPAAANVKQSVRYIESKLGIKMPTNEAFFDGAIENGAAYVIPRRYLDDGVGGYRSEDLLVIEEGFYRANNGLDAVHHELVHMIAESGPKNFLYDIRAPINSRDGLFSGIYELMTEIWTDIAMGRAVIDKGVVKFRDDSRLAVGSYATSQYPDLLKVLSDRLFLDDKDTLKHFLAFGLHGDANRLVSDVVGTNPFKRFQTKIDQGVVDIANAMSGKRLNSYGSVDEEKFYNYLRNGRGVNFNAISVEGAAIGLALGAEGMSGTPFSISRDFFSDEFLHDLSSSDAEAIITEVDGNISPGAQLEVGTVVLEEDRRVNNDEYQTIWAFLPKNFY